MCIHKEWENKETTQGSVETFVKKNPTILDASTDSKGETSEVAESENLTTTKVQPENQGEKITEEETE